MIPMFICVYNIMYIYMYTLPICSIYIYISVYFRLGVGEEDGRAIFFGYRCCTILEYATFGLVYVVMVPNVVLDGTESFEQPHGFEHVWSTILVYIRLFSLYTPCRA